ncbi:MAG: nucleotide exchange factor GrpE [Clostridiales bacterium]|nr:nucleotide exchange factor GrpE [Clostridiales bacterium]
MTDKKKAFDKAKSQAADEELKDDQASKAAEGAQDSVVDNDAAKDSYDNAKGSTAEAKQGSEQSAEDKESERYMRLMAEFQNYKKRTAKEKSDIHAYGNEKLLLELLPVFDNFERALATNVTDDPEAYAQGMGLIFNQMKEAIAKVGIEEIVAEGEEFNPDFHNAVMTEDSEEHDAGKVTKVLQKGYKLNSKVVRPSMVVVSK